MNRFAAIAMSSLILLTVLRDVLSIASFYYNQEDISLNFCKNRFKPEAMCKGKCVLNNTLTQNHEQEENKKTIPQLEERFVYVLPVIVLYTKLYSKAFIKKEIIAYQNFHYSSSYLENIFRPPPFFS